MSKIRQWEDFFVWFPTKIDGKFVWLKTCKRRMLSGWDFTSQGDGFPPVYEYSINGERAVNEAKEIVLSPEELRLKELAEEFYELERQYFEVRVRSTFVSPSTSERLKEDILGKRLDAKESEYRKALAVL